MNTIATCGRQPWNEGNLVGQKAAPTARYLGHPNKASNAERARDLDLFDLAIDSNLRAGDLTKLRVRDIAAPRPYEAREHRSISRD